jgi:hypothetical protein
MGTVEQAVREAAFAILRRGEKAAPALIAARAGLGQGEVQAALGSLLAAGQVEVDADGGVVGAAGLTLLATRHRLVLGGVALHTWCAIDAVGIPAALGQDAEVRTSCPHCGRELAIRFLAGRLVADPGFIAWLPTDPCTNVREELCPRANLFCDAAHLDAWRAAWAEPQEEALSLPEVEARGRRWWGIFNEQQGGEQ